MADEQQRRQTIGRGLRLCVNQQGERVKGFEVNNLTVIATESYQSFAEKLQQGLEKDTLPLSHLVGANRFDGNHLPA
jgi:type III restriction enzyme